MWYWVLPSAVLTGACIFIPQVLFTATNLIGTGYLNRRNYDADSRDYYLYLRDRRITGSEYVQSGLENLDKPINPKNTGNTEIPWKS